MGAGYRRGSSERQGVVRGVQGTPSEHGRIGLRHSLDVDAEARDLREIGGTGQVQYVHVVEHLDAVEAAEDEDTAVGEAGGVVPACGWCSACDLAWFVL